MENTCRERKITVRDFTREEIFLNRIQEKSKEIILKIGFLCKRAIESGNEELKQKSLKTIIDFLSDYIGSLNENSSEQEIDTVIYIIRKAIILEEKILFFIDRLKENLEDNINLSFFGSIVLQNIELYFKHHIGDYSDKNFVIKNTNDIFDKFFMIEGIEQITLIPFMNELFINYLMYSYYTGNIEDIKKYIKEFESTFLNKYKNFESDLKLLKCHEIYIELLLGNGKNLEGLIIMLKRLDDGENHYVKAVTMMAEMLFKTHMKTIKSKDIMNVINGKSNISTSDQEFDIDFHTAMGDGFMEIAHSCVGTERQIQNALVPSISPGSKFKEYFEKAAGAYARALDIARKQTNGLLKIRPAIKAIRTEKSEPKKIMLFWEAFEAFLEHFPEEDLENSYLGTLLIEAGKDVLFKKKLLQASYPQEILKKYEKHLNQKELLLEGKLTKDFESSDKFLEDMEKDVKGLRFIIIEATERNFGFSRGFDCDFDFMQLDQGDELVCSKIDYKIEYAKLGLFSKTLVCREIEVGGKKYVIFADRGENSNTPITEAEIEKLGKILSTYIKLNDKHKRAIR